MKAFPRILTYSFMFVMIAFSASCKTARYQIIGPEQVKGTEPPLPPCENCPDNHEPSADLEAIVDGKSVTSVPVGQALTLRPSADTLDPDDFGLENSCKINPGIVTAKYTQEKAAIDTSIQRSACENLSIEHTFTVPGLYFIELEVSSNEDEKALASMTLAVYNPGVQQATSKGFDIQANPLVTDIGKDVTFASNCELDHKGVTEWSYGDGEKASGASVKHPYPASGSFEVSATCKNMQASLTVVVLQKDHKIDLEKAPIKKPGTNPDGSNPNQNGPGQTNQDNIQQQN